MASESYVGEIALFACDFAPRGWALCDGQLLSIQTNAALFSIIGTYYGGDGSRTFAVPDLRGCVPIGTGQSRGSPYYVLGERGGRDRTTLSIGNMPSHAHSLLADVKGGGETLPTGHALGASAEKVYSSKAPAAPLNGLSVGPTGRGVPFETRQPYLALNYCIALVGVFPTRG